MSGVISSIITNSSATAALNSLDTINSQLNTVQTAVSTGYRVSSAVQDKINALNDGVGALLDANMAAESVKLQSLQIQQQLATSSLSIANQAPSLLTKLFP